MSKLHRQLADHRQSHLSTHRNKATSDTATAADRDFHPDGKGASAERDGAAAPLADRLLVVDDNESLRELLRASLEQRGYLVTVAADGREALALVEATSFDLVLLDIILPRLNGFHLCQQIREQSHVPIIIISAMNREEDVVQGLQVGADDYIAKPFAFNEVQARIMAMLRRTQERQMPRQHLLPDEIKLDEKQQRALIGGEPMDLSPTEYRLLHHLALRAGQPVARESLLRDVWTQQPKSGTRILHTNIRRLRQKIEANPDEPRYILTVPGVGYKLSTATEAAIRN